MMKKAEDKGEKKEKPSIMGSFPEEEEKVDQEDKQTKEAEESKKNTIENRRKVS